ncbi:MAG: pilC 1 [Verrucomicrobiales bacterium]|nr:pilC 1 [Verrucomicrobiales bacterium]
MSNFAYVAFDAHGRETKGLLDVEDQSEAVRRLKEMGYFPTKVVQRAVAAAKKEVRHRKATGRSSILTASIPMLGRGVKPKVLCTFTRQLATLIQAGMPLLRGLRILEEQETNPALKRVIAELAFSIEDGGTLSEALAQHPKVFNRLYVNMIKAGEMGGVLEVVLKRLAEFMEKAQKIKGKIVAAMFYPAAVITVAVAIMAILMVFVVPKFKDIFAGLLGGRPMPAFTVFILNISEAVKSHFVLTAGIVAACIAALKLFGMSQAGRRFFDRCKLSLPVIGPVLRKSAISRFSRTFGTLMSSGVPILQTLMIVKETAGNVIVGDAVSAVHECVKEGETITVPLKASGIFPSMVVGMVDVGEQTGALPEMLMKIADTYDEDVDNAVASMTSLLEPIMIVFLAIVVGSIVIALFLPLIGIIDGIDSDSGSRADG